MFHQRSKSGLFLVELIIAIVFFAVASAICVRMFVMAHLISTHSADISAASMLAQNYAESYKSLTAQQREEFYFGQGDAFNEELFYGLDPSGTLIYLEPEQRDDAVYLLTVLHDKTFSPTLTARVHVFKYDGKAPTSEDVALFSLDVKSYGGGAA